MSCCALCSKWYEKCHISFRKSKDRDGILNRQVAVLPQYEKVPLDKIFELRQRYVPLAIHPHFRRQSLITEQPTMFYPAVAESPVTRSSFFEDSVFQSFPLSASIPVDLSSNLPTIEFIIFYDIQSYSFTVKLIRARNLPAMNRNGTSDPFVSLFLLPHREEIFRSKTYYKTLNPSFNETFVFGNIPYNEIFTRSLILRVLDENAVCHNELIGNVILPLWKTELHGVRVSAVLNEDSDVGQVSTVNSVKALHHAESHSVLILFF